MVRFILGLIGIIVALDVLWGIAAARLSRHVAVRLPAVLFGAAQIGGLVWLLTQRFSHSESTAVLSKFAMATVFIWHMIILPLLLVITIALVPVFVVATARRIVRRGRVLNSAFPQTGGALTRRQFVGLAVAAVPPLLNISLASIAMRQLDRFRVRRFVVPIATLPADLHGLTILQVSDMHVGRFTSGRVLREMVRVINELRADLLVLTGDLINDSIGDLTHALDLVRSMEGRLGLYLIEGNHDLIDNGAEFERRMKGSGIPFLLDESTIADIHGTSVQLLGLGWTRSRQNRDAAIAASVRQLMTQRQPETFPILLAHHPHAFDAAAEASIPLTLSGHTHGGQLMLNERCGFGPALFRYWSGLYVSGASKLIVSNGVGNWFPLRVRAPAELVHIELVRG